MVTKQELIANLNRDWYEQTLAVDGVYFDEGTHGKFSFFVESKLISFYLP